MGNAGAYVLQVSIPACLSQPLTPLLLRAGCLYPWAIPWLTLKPWQGPWSSFSYVLPSQLAPWSFPQFYAPPGPSPALVLQLQGAG